MKTDVIIVGAGPSGLASACQLIRCGIDFVIFDKNRRRRPIRRRLACRRARLRFMSRSVWLIN